jgi:uncharacterized protein (DUF1778 family)
MTAHGAAQRSPSASRTERLEARVSADQKALFQQAAEAQGRTLTDFIIASAHEAAVRALQDLQSIRLNAEESEAFARALLEPRAPNARLRAAAERYKAATSAQTA